MIEPGSFDNAIVLRDLYVIIVHACTYDCKPNMYNYYVKCHRNLAGNLLSNIPDDLFENSAINDL